MFTPSLLLILDSRLHGAAILRHGGAASVARQARDNLGGDADCGGTISPVDALKLLRFDAGLSSSQAEGCPAMGESVTIVEG